MAEPITVGKALLSAGSLAAKIHTRLQELGNTAKLLDAQAVDARSWRAMRDAETERRLSRLEGTAEGTAAVAEMVAESQYARLHRNLEFEAAREATDERRRLLAHLAAGLSEPELTINEKARIERAARELDPSDLPVLREIRERRFGSAGEQENFFARFASSTDALVNTSCIRRRRGLGDANSTESMFVTELGVQLLAAIDSYREAQQ